MRVWFGLLVLLAWAGFANAATWTDTGEGLPGTNNWVIVTTHPLDPSANAFLALNIYDYDTGGEFAATFNGNPIAGITTSIPANANVNVTATFPIPRAWITQGTTAPNQLVFSFPRRPASYRVDEATLTYTVAPVTAATPPIRSWVKRGATATTPQRVYYGMFYPDTLIRFGWYMDIPPTLNARVHLFWTSPLASFGPEILPDAIGFQMVTTPCDVAWLWAADEGPTAPLMTRVAKIAQACNVP